MLFSNAMSSIKETSTVLEVTDGIKANIGLYVNK